MCLKINRSVKTPFHRPSMGVASSGLWAPDGIQFTWNTQNTRSFGKFLAGNPTRPPAPVTWLPVGRRSSSQVTSAMSIPFSE